MIIIKRLFRKVTAAAGDFDPYYTVMFLQQEFDKKDLGGVFTDPSTGKKYSTNYIASMKNHGKPVTDDFLEAVKFFVPDFEERYHDFVDHTQNGSNFVPVEEADDEQMKERIKQQNEIAELTKSTEQPTSSFSKYLVALTKLNVAQIKHALNGKDPNETKVDAEGKKKIPAELIRKAQEVFGFPVDDFKQFRQSGTTSYTNQAIGDLQKKYKGDVVQANVTSRLKKISK